MMVPAQISFLSTVDQYAAGVMGELCILIQAVKEIGRHRLPGFDLNRDFTEPEIDNEVHFKTTAVAPEIERRPLPVVEENLLDLVDNEILKNSTPQGVKPQVFGLTDPQ